MTFTRGIAPCCGALLDPGQKPGARDHLEVVDLPQYCRAKHLYVAPRSERVADTVLVPPDQVPNGFPQRSQRDRARSDYSRVDVSGRTTATGGTIGWCYQSSNLP